MKLIIKWTILVILSFGLAASLEWLGLPAGLLLGPMIIAILFAVNGKALKTSRPLFIFAQGIVGVMIASNLPLDVFGEIYLDWAGLSVRNHGHFYCFVIVGLVDGAVRASPRHHGNLGILARGRHFDDIDE